MAIKKISLGMQAVQFGVRDDPERIRKLVGEFKHWLDAGLDPNRFVMSPNDPKRWRSRGGLNIWPEGEKQLELWAVNFGIVLPNYPALLEEASSLPADYQRGGFCHLATHFSVEKVVALYEQGIRWLEATDENSLWRCDDGDLYAPYVVCDPNVRYLSAYWVENERFASGWFLFACE